MSDATSNPKKRKDIVVLFVRTRDRVLFGVLGLLLLVSLGFNAKFGWDAYSRVGWRGEVEKMAQIQGQRDAWRDYGKGLLRLLEVRGPNPELRFSGETDGPFEIWISPCFPSFLATAHQFEREHYIDSYNWNMRRLHEGDAERTNE